MGQLAKTPDVPRCAAYLARGQGAVPRSPLRSDGHKPRPVATAAAARRSPAASLKPGLGPRGRAWPRPRGGGEGGRGQALPLSVAAPPLLPAGRKQKRHFPSEADRNQRPPPRPAGLTSLGCPSRPTPTGTTAPPRRPPSLGLTSLSAPRLPHTKAQKPTAPPHGAAAAAACS
jgi:hypothetical protein